LIDANLYMLLVTASGTAVIHTLIPDHWLPFVLIGRARNWSLRTTAMVSGVSALIHVGLSVVLGLVTLALGFAASEVIGESLERAAGILLILFGLVYAIWAWRKGGHFHPGGERLHQNEQRPTCDGREGHTDPEHQYFHADVDLIRSRSEWTRLWLALIIGANPCVLLIPIMLIAAEKGGTMLGLVSAAYAVPTICLMVGLSVLGVAGSRGIRLPGAARHMEMASGLLIMILGLVVLWLE
jgi:nickel/cobalt exporter